MIRIFGHYVSGKIVLLVGLELAVLLLAAYIGISFQFSAFGAVVPDFNVVLSPRVGALPFGMLIVFTSMGLYQGDVWENSKSLQIRLAAAGFVGCVLAVAVTQMMPSFQFGSDALMLSVIVALAGSGMVRFALYKWDDSGISKPRVLVLGTGSRVSNFAKYAERNRNHVVVGYVAPHASEHYVPLSDVVPLGNQESLASLAERKAIDHVVVAVRDRREGGLPLQELLKCKLKGIKVSELPAFFEREYRQVLLESINPSWIVFGDGFRVGSNAILKRIIDVVASATLLLLSLPVLAIAAVCIVLESGGPVFYRQERVGQRGRRFTIYKLRSMRTDAEIDGKPRWAATNDDRITRVGRIIRKLRIDELPQIINVLNGDMSFVGPRPERPYFVDSLVKQIPYFDLRHAVKPGITGWAQVSCAYGATIDDAIEKLQYDLYYVKNQGLFLDLMILLATIEVVLWGKGAR